ncbi:MAG: HAMP domain-containing histidine kinase, partial [Defluviitaleaceae bacterium]|nr:HAMP domain-containing histidine kinase [Defluviitaleaceae bacterium]
MNKKRTRMHKRIFFAFSAVFFVSYLLVTVVFDTFIRSDEPFIQTSEYRQSFAEYHGIELDPDNRLFAVRLLGIPLFAFVGVLFVVSLVVTYFLSDSITRPIERLGKFATSIGPNNLEPKDFSFKDQELADLNTALNQTVTQLAVYDSEQKAFFQNASHELRTPLMSIQSYAEGIIYDVMQPKDAAETILQETHRMAELVKDLLYIAQLGNITAVYKKEPVD